MVGTVLEQLAIACSTGLGGGGGPHLEREFKRWLGVLKMIKLI